MKNKTRCLIIGSGPAGYTAAIYASRANLEPILYEGLEPGGQLTTTTEVENFPGYPEGITGPEMMEELKKQAQRFGTDVRSGRATAVDFSAHPHKVTIDNEQVIEADTVIISTGASAKYRGLPDETKYAGQGVSACATCDGFFYRGKEIAVIGGGNTAVEEALYLTNFASKVTLIHRRDEFRASAIMEERARNNEKIRFATNKVVEEVVGDGSVSTLKLKDTVTGEISELPVTAMFVAIGHDPRSQMVAGQVDLDESGYVKVDSPSTRTSLPGVFAAGDLVDSHYQQAISAAGTGCTAAIDAEHHLASLG